MVFHIFTILPESMQSYFNSSILARAQKSKLIEIKVYDIRDFTEDKHKTTDDSPFGGGPGMVMKVDSIIKAIESVFGKKRKKPLVVLTSAAEKEFDRKIARNFAKENKDIVIICGRYEGVDERVKDVLIDRGYDLKEMSIGHYVLTGGELAAMVMVDAISRHISGVLGKEESLEEIKGSYPVYTRPEIFEYKKKKYKTPEVLMSGDHKKIEEWRVLKCKIQTSKCKMKKKNSKRNLMPSAT